MNTRRALFNFCLSRLFVYRFNCYFRTWFCEYSWSLDGKFLKVKSVGVRINLFLLLHELHLHDSTYCNFCFKSVSSQMFVMRRFKPWNARGTLLYTLETLNLYPIIKKTFIRSVTPLSTCIALRGHSVYILNGELIFISNFPSNKLKVYNINEIPANNRYEKHM